MLSACEVSRYSVVGVVPDVHGKYIDIESGSKASLTGASLPKHPAVDVASADFRSSGLL